MGYLEYHKHLHIKVDLEIHSIKNEITSIVYTYISNKDPKKLSKSDCV